MTGIEPADLARDMARLGVRQGDACMVHASMRRIGPVQGGTSGVLDALDAAVGESGTLMMILGAVVEGEWVNQRPESEREALLRDVPVYDPLASPVLPEVGFLAEAFRTRTGTIVTDNPSGRFAARGARAAELLTGAPWHDYYGPDSPLDRLCRMGGRVLRMGASPDTSTVLHYAEYLANVPGKRRVTRHYRVQGDAGPVTRSVSCLDDEFGIVDWGGDDYFALILGEYLGQGRGITGRVGGAESQLIEAADLVAFGAEWMGRHLGR